MAVKSRKTRILGALVVAGVLIAVAYISSSSTFSIPALFAPATANAESTQALLEAYAQKVGPDGKPLWEEELINESSSTPLSNATTSSDAIADSLPGTAPAPGSMTDQFAQNLFSQYMNQFAGTQPSEDDIDTFAENAVQTAATDHQKNVTYTSSNITIQGSGPDSLRSYIVSEESSLAQNSVPDMQEGDLDYFADAVEKGDVSALNKVAQIGITYTALSSSYASVPVPTDAEEAHLEIANAFANLGEDFTDMSKFNSDPLRAYLGLSAYQNDTLALTKGFSDMDQVLKEEGVTFNKTDEGYDLYAACNLAATDMQS